VQFELHDLASWLGMGAVELPRSSNPS
jgi:hypothetical protein